jgi:exonuclease I
MAKKAKKRKPIVFKPVTFKLTARQKKSLEKNCKARSTTPIKLIKKSIDNYLSLTVAEKPMQYVSPNQLNLFEDEEC